MLGWLKRSKPAASELESGPVATLALDKIGRPMRPRLHGFSNREDATTDQKLMALEWAKEWTGNSLLPIPVEDLLKAMEDSFTGRKRLKDNDPARPVVGHALRALSLSAQETRAERTKGAFPWVELRLGPQDHPCQAAEKLANQLIPFAMYPHIPLPECDEAECNCWLRQVTKAEAAKRGAHNG